MRIWDLSPKKLCRNHLLGEHRELHAIWSVITNDKKGYAQHPETSRWRGKLKALFYRHVSPLAKQQATGSRRQREYVDTPRRQVVILRGKKCHCDV